MRQAKYLTAAVMLVAVIIVVFQNTETVETRILFASIEMPRAALLAGTYVIGALTGFLLTTRMFRRKPQPA